MRYVEAFFQRTDSTITSPFGWRTHPITGEYSFHKGVDYWTLKEKWPVYSLEAGYILASNTDATNGNYIWVVYPRINRKFFLCHLSDRLVAKGDEVTAGMLMCHVGETGRATGIHLHLGMQGLDTGVYANHELEEYFPIVEEEEVVVEEKVELSSVNKRALLRRKKDRKARTLLTNRTDTNESNTH